MTGVSWEPDDGQATQQGPRKSKAKPGSEGWHLPGKAHVLCSCPTPSEQVPLDIPHMGDEILNINFFIILRYLMLHRFLI